MCGICGFNWEDKKLIKRMAYVLKHRGSEDEGYFIDKNISLGHKRLKIIDLSKNAKQPIHNEDNTIFLIYNGEIYNFKELREKLEKKHKFYTNTDGEVIIHAYEEYHEDFVRYLNGMFAIAIWDSNKRKLVLARDRLGIKPLFYYLKDGKIMFASEIKSILQHVKPELSYKTLSELFGCRFSLRTETLFKGINEIKPGEILTYNNPLTNYWSSNDYWGLEYYRPEIEYNEQFYINKLKSLLEDSIKKRLISDVPLGVTLSGGIDSSSIVALMSKHCKNIKTFTAGYGESDDEFKYAKLVADKFGTDHKEILIPYKDITESIPKILWHMESAIYKETPFPTYFYSKEIKKDVKVCLMGEGADELFAGYPRHMVFSPKFYIPKYKDIYNLRFMMSSLLPNKAFSLLDPINLKAKSVRLNTLTKSESNSLLSKKVGRFNPSEHIYPYIQDSKKSNILNKFLLFEIKKELPNSHLNRVDRMTMAHTLEARVPFLDHRLVEFSMTIPPKFKLNKFGEKYILKKTMKGILPPEILNRKKVGLKTPFEQWFEKDLFKIIPNIIESSKKRDWFNKRGVEKLLKKPRFDIRNYYKMRRVRQLIFLTMLELFYKIYFENDNLYKPNLSLNKIM